MKHGKPKILVIGTGGAISAKTVHGIWKYGEMKQEELIDMMPEIRHKFQIKTLDLLRIDSSDFTPDHWLTIANTIYYNMKDYDGIVVTMGTDTMHFADTAISFLIQNNNIPIVFTGSKVNPLSPSSDAGRNLTDAITLAGTSDIAEAVIVFDGEVFRAARTKKINASEFRAFGSTTAEPLGKVEQFIRLKGPYRKRSGCKPVLYRKLDIDVAIMKVYPGFDGNRIVSLIKDGATGIVIEGFGLGNMPLHNNAVERAIKYANSMNVPIVVTSDCVLGEYWKEIVEAEVGSRIKRLKIIHAYDMLPETAYVKLMWVLGQTRKYEEVKKMMQKNYVGEITEYKRKKSVY